MRIQKAIFGEVLPKSQFRVLLCFVYWWPSHTRRAKLVGGGKRRTIIGSAQRMAPRKKQPSSV
jgi:hypothetical protein